MSFINKIENIIPQCLNIACISKYKLYQLKKDSQSYYHLLDCIKYINNLPEKYRTVFLETLSKSGSNSQFMQDVFVLSVLNNKTNGFFVEFGAANGFNDSNSYILENRMAWKGIVAEPGANFTRKLKQNRKCFVETDCLWSKTGEKIKFNEVTDGKLSTVDEFTTSDAHAENRIKGSRKKYEVKTISLTDMLVKYNAPKTIDYLSIDTEGTEFEILNAFDFNKYKFNVITCEHNFNTTQRDLIYNLLSSNGYIRVCEDISHIDDWYINEETAKNTTLSLN